MKSYIGFSSLGDKVKAACDELDPIVGIFGKHLYSMNHEELTYKEMGQRLGEQRNHYAHGDLDKDFIGLALLDVFFLEYIIYAMQLKRCGVDDDSIKKAINELFHLNFVI